MESITELYNNFLKQVTHDEFLNKITTIVILKKIQEDGNYDILDTIYNDIFTNDNAFNLYMHIITILFIDNVKFYVSARCTTHNLINSCNKYKTQLRKLQLISNSKTLYFLNNLNNNYIINSRYNNEDLSIYFWYMCNDLTNYNLQFHKLIY